MRKFGPPEFVQNSNIGIEVIPRTMHICRWELFLPYGFFSTVNENVKEMKLHKSKFYILW